MSEDGNRGQIVFAILSYSVVSLSVVYFNWWLFTSGFKYPVFVSWIQQIIGFCIFSLGSLLSRYFLSLRKFFPHASFEPGVIWQCIPLSIAFVLCIGLSNICLQKTLISTYQVARSLTLLFVIILSYIMLREKQSYIVLGACGLMVIGFVTGSLDPTTISIGGVVAGGLSSFFQSLYNVLIKRTLPFVGSDNQMLLFYNVLLSSFLFLPMVLVTEDSNSWRQAFGLDPQASPWLIWGSMILSGVLGTTLNMTQYLLINVTTPLTFNIVGFVKSLFQSMGGIVFFGDAVTPESLIGILLCFTGSALYAKAKNDALKATSKEADSVQLIPNQERLENRTNNDDS